MKKTKTTTFSMILILVAGWCLIVPAAGLADCPDDIVAYWKLNEAPGETTYVDYIGNNAAEVNAPNTPPTAVPLDGINGAQLFGGATSGIDVPASKAFNWAANDSFSIELWVKTDVTPTANKVLVGRGQTAPNNVFWWVGLNANDGKPVFLIREADGSNRKIIGSTVLSNNEWYHVVATRNGETDEQSLYVNGNLEAVTLSQTGNMLSGLATPDVLSIGYVDDGFRFTGLIDEVAIYDGVLPKSEILAHFNSGSDYCAGAAAPVATFAPFPEDTVALWSLDDTRDDGAYWDSFGDKHAEVNAPNTPPTAVPLDGINGAQLFGGATSGIDVPASKAFNWAANDSFSIELWVKTDVTPTANKVLVGRGQTAATNVFWWVGLNANDGKPVFLIREADGSNRKIIGSTVLSNNEWYHVVATRNGETDEQSLYVNGNLEAVTLSQTGNMLSGLATPDVLSIGYVDDGFRFTGLIDEVAIYDRVLDLDDDIVPHFIAGDGGNGNNVQSLRPAPTANAGDDQADVPERSEVTLTGSGSTYDGATITDYFWTQTAVTPGTGVTLSDPTVASPIFTAPDVDASTTLTFQLIVTASDGQSSNPDEVTVTITDVTDGGGGTPPPPADGGGGGGGGCFISSMF